MEDKNKVFMIADKSQIDRYKTEIGVMDDRAHFIDYDIGNIEQSIINTFKKENIDNLKDLNTVVIFIGEDNVNNVNQRLQEAFMWIVKKYDVLSIVVHICKDSFNGKFVSYFDESMCKDLDNVFVKSFMKIIESKRREGTYIECTRNQLYKLSRVLKINRNEFRNIKDFFKGQSNNHYQETKEGYFFPISEINAFFKKNKFSKKEQRSIQKVNHKVIKKADDFNLKEKIQQMYQKNGIIDGDQLSDLFFPTEEYDFFISHLHEEKQEIKKFANYLMNEGFTVFLDSDVWGSVYELLKTIDDNYSKKERGKYDYYKRNETTSNIYLMLAIAIGNVISKSKKIIFTNIGKSEIKDEQVEFSLSSPWIYLEIYYFNLIYYHQMLGVNNYGNGDLSFRMLINRKPDTKNLKSLKADNFEEELETWRKNILGQGLDKNL